MDGAWPECTVRCRSLQHALDVISVITRGSEQQIKAFLSLYCCNATTLKDDFGRNAVHMSASCGKKGVLEWLAAKGMELAVKDKESGWTALHRSIFYGHIDCALTLLKHGSNLHVQDKDGFTALDLVMKDRPSHIVFQASDPTELYTWGNNVNFTLGHGSQQSKRHPELVDMFPRCGIYIKQMVLCKFHSVFLSQKGQVYTCGHGQGGRLGHGDELTCLVPRLVKGLTTHSCSQVAAAKDHTLVLTEDGYVYSFGLNTFHQLGIFPPLPHCNVPRQVHAKTLKGKSVIGIAAGRFHTVLWTKDAVYTMGLNGGQLGYLLDPNGEKHVGLPRQVSALHHKDFTVSLVSASDGATVCASERGDVYLLTEYQCKKLASKQLNLKKLLVSGGGLDNKVDLQNLKENGGQPVQVLALDQAGRVFCWKSTNSSLRQCRWVYGRQVFISDFALNKNEMFFITNDGEGFSGKWMPEKKLSLDKKDSVHSDTHSMYDRICLQKLPFVHRAISVATDPNGCNFAVLQSDPKTSLFEIPVVSSSIFVEDFKKLLNEVDEMDSIHDVTFYLGSQAFPAHRYILAMKSDFFRKLFFSEDTNQADLPDIYQNGEDSAGCDLFVIEKVSPVLFYYILQFVYTDTCDMLVHGHKPKYIQKEKIEENQDTLISDFQKIRFAEDVRGKSAYEVYRNNQICADNEKKKGKMKTSKKSKCGSEEISPVKMLQNLAKKFGMSSLSARLDEVRYENGAINAANKKSENRSRFFIKKCSSLCDVTIRSEDGKEFHCHKCVLCGRLEYFHSMLSSSWIEASCCSALQMPVHSEVLQVILDYIYTDEAPTVNESANMELICNVLVMADQLLVARLKEMCEVALTERLTLKNAAELLEFAALYRADQLKVSCFQFIGLNMAALLEARSLDILSEDVLTELSSYYRKMIPAMDKRLITPYLDGPDISTLEYEECESFMSTKDDSISESTPEALFKKAKSKAKRRPRKRSDSSGGYNLSDVIQSPPLSGFFKSEKNNSVESLQDLLTSDSEGSFAGASSPRDLQSPDFTVTSPQKTEEKNKVYDARSVTSPPAGIGSTGIKVPQHMASSPKSIPNIRASPGSSQNWVAVALSPVSPPPMDLRTIMEIEENKQKCGATPKQVTGTPQKPTAHGIKLSQKQRKMMALSYKEGGGNAENSTNTSTSAANMKSPPKTWATCLQHEGEPKAFRNLLREQQKPVVLSALADTGKKSTHVTEMDPQTSAGRTSETIAPESKWRSNVPKLESSNPWLLSLSKNKPSVVPVTFAMIVEEEKKQEAALIRSREKPLALIQIEERAIQDLLVHYQAIDNPEEYITVERSAQGPIATPMWNKH